MARDIKGTRTEKNILTAFAGESQARNRYSFYASQAKDTCRSDILRDGQS